VQQVLLGGPEIKVPPEVRLFYCRVCRSHMQGKRWFRMKSAPPRDMEDAAMTEVARLAELPEGVSISYVRADVLKEDERGSRSASP
jgi:NMD protein affecting ribosome stability and mRNA decay